MEINILKAKEMVLGRLAITNLPLLSISSQTIARVTSYKLRGMYTLTLPSPGPSTLTIKQLKRAGLPNSHLLHFYKTAIRPVLEYCAPVWHCALTKAQSESLEAIHHD